MKFPFNTLREGSLLILLLSSINSLANECAIVQIMPSVVDGKDVVYELVGHNGRYIEALNKPSQYNAAIDGEHKYYLSPGQHTIQVNQWMRRNYLNIKRNNYSADQLSRITYETSTVHLDIEKDKVYKLEVIDQVNTKERKFSVSQVEKMQCEQESVLAAKKVKKIDNYLPKKLNYKLQHLMAELAKYAEVNLIPLEVDWSFGATLDDDVSKKYLKLLAVFPHSFAKKLNLASGDEIISINGGEVELNNEDPYSFLYGQLAKRDFGQEFSLIVRRGIKNIEISERYLPQIIPTVNYQIISSKEKVKESLIINETKLPENIKYQYSQLMKEITEFVKTQESDFKTVILFSEEEYDQVYGIVGNYGYRNSQFGFDIARVDSNTAAADIKLKKGDFITAINNKSLLEDENLMLVKEIKALQKNGRYKLTVIRNHQPIELIGTYSPQLFPSFKLSIDLAEHLLAINSLNKMVNEPARFTKSRYLLYNMGIDIEGSRKSSVRHSEKQVPRHRKPSTPSKPKPANN